MIDIFLIRELIALINKSIRRLPYLLLTYFCSTSNPSYLSSHFKTSSLLPLLSFSYEAFATIAHSSYSPIPCLRYSACLLRFARSAIRLIYDYRHIFPLFRLSCRLTPPIPKPTPTFNFTSNRHPHYRHPFSLFDICLSFYSLRLPTIIVFYCL